MRPFLKVFLLVLVFVLSHATVAARDAQTKATLLLSKISARPGEDVMAALRLVSNPGWHTYWRNPGDAGFVTSVEWTLPAGVTVGQWEWPAPHKLEISKISAYVYEGETLLLFPVHIGKEVPVGPLSLKGKASWLECDDSNCVPAGGDVQAAISIGSDSAPSPDAALIEQWQARIPKPAPNGMATAAWDGPPRKDSRALLIEWTPSGTVSKPDFYSFESDDFKVQADTEILQADAKKVRLRKQVELTSGKSPTLIRGLILDESGVPKPLALQVSLQPANAVMASAGNQNPKATVNGGVEVTGTSASSTSFLAVLGFAFLGGLILNVMPCVLPVIALKILGFVSQSREQPRRIRQLGIFYMLGVLTSFLVLAGAIIGVKQAGGSVNWGMQMQNPYFVVAMTAVITLVALNLWGVFEITLSGRALGAASELAAREGLGGAFYNGVLTTLLATPCTAPALTFAVGSVLTQSAGYIIATFLMIGFGLGLPYLLLSLNPSWLKILPKPGPWMEKFKMAMGFPIAATAIWLLSLASSYFGDSGPLWVGLFLVFLALAAWIYGEFVQRGRTHRGVAAVLSLLVLGGGYFYTLERELNWRSPQALLASNSEELNVRPGEIPWKRWSPNAVAQARKEGRAVLVDFTARWCFTCQVNKKTSLEVDSVRKRIAELNVLPLVADFTVPNPEMAEEIQKHKRAGVPLVIVYPGNPSADPIILPPGLLTPGIVLNALEMSAKETSTAVAKADKIASGS